MKIFLTSIFAQTILTGYIFYHAWHAVPSGKTWRLPLVGLFVVEILLFFTGFFFHKVLDDKFLYFLQMVCGTWFIAAVYLSMCLFVMDILRIINHFFPFFPKYIRTYYRQIKIFLFFFFPSLVIFFLSCGFYSFNHPKVKYQTIEIHKKAGKLEKFRIAFATDIHAGYIVDKNQLHKYIDLINAQHCDLIMLGGDMIDYDLHILNMEDMASEFRRLHAPQGVYAVLGNHERRFDTEKKVEWLRSAGLTVLKDTVIMPELSFYLIGRDDKKNEDRRSLSYLTTGLDRSKPIIVIDHQPASLGENLMNQVDFTAHGHVHNGQIWPYNYAMYWFWNGFSEGYHRLGKTQMYISSGLGLSGPPFRVFTDSEVIVFELVFKAATNKFVFLSQH